MRTSRRTTTPSWGALCLTVGTLLAAAVGALGQHAQAQTQRPPDARDAAPVQWTLRLDGRPAPWPFATPTAPLDSVQAVAARTVRHLRQDGYFFATVDSATVRRGQRPPQVQLHARRGPQVPVEQVHIRDASSRTVLTEDAIRQIVDVPQGQPLDADRLARRIDELLARYDAAGHPLAEVRMDRLHVSSESPPALTLTLHVDPGPKLWLKRIAVPADVRTSPGLIAQLAPVTRGAPLTDYDPDAIRAALQGSGLFAEVGRPELRVGADGGAELFVPITESSPGAFDLVLGYLPPSQTGGTGQVVGTGHLELENVFGGGRTASLELDRRPGQASLLDVSAADPYLFGEALRLKGQFRGEQRDSTFGKQTLRLTGGVRVAPSLRLDGTVAREVTRPGFAGAQLSGDRQRIARAETWLYGAGLHYAAVDDRRNPRRGGWLDVHVEQGRKSQRLQRVTRGDTIAVQEALRQERLQAQGRLYVPVRARSVLVAGGEVSALLSGRYDRSDLFRIGGATSLRGYDEDRFLGNVVGRALIEYRVQLDRVSYAYGFGDLGFVQRPETQTLEPARNWHPGFGIGVQVGTALGIVNATYALNTGALRPSNGRVHLGLSVGL